MDTNKIRILLAVAETHSISTAAKVLKITPPAVSQSIKAIEKDLGFQLFARVGKKLMPSELTLELCRISSEYFRAIGDLINGDDNPIYQGKLRVGAVPEFGNGWLVPKASLYLTTHDKVSLQLTFSDTKKLIHELLDYKIDIAFLDGGSHLDEFQQFHVTEIANEELVMCSSAKFYKDHFKSGASLSNLQRVNHIPYHDGKEGVYKWYQHHFKRTPKIKFNLTVDSSRGVLIAVKQNLGIGVVPRYMLTESIADKEIVVLFPKGKQLLSSVVCCQLKDKVPSRIEKDFLSFCSQ